MCVTLHTNIGSLLLLGICQRNSSEGDKEKKKRGGKRKRKRGRERPSCYGLRCASRRERASFGERVSVLLGGERQQGREGEREKCAHAVHLSCASADLDVVSLQSPTLQNLSKLARSAPLRVFANEAGPCPSSLSAVPGFGVSPSKVRLGRKL